MNNSFVKLGLVLLALWLASWVLFMWVWPEASYMQVPLLTWSQLVLGFCTPCVGALALWFSTKGDS